VAGNQHQPRGRVAVDQCNRETKSLGIHAQKRKRPLDNIYKKGSQICCYFGISYRDV
jgi:hypothetical protein